MQLSNVVHRGLSIALALGMLVTPTLGVTATQVSSVQISSVSIYAGTGSTPGAFVIFSPGIPGLEGCSNPAGNELWIDFSSIAQPDGRTLFETVRAANLANRAMSFGVSGCGDNGKVPLIYRVDVVNT
jgi:hypothetical protein